MFFNRIIRVNRVVTLFVIPAAKPAGARFSLGNETGVGRQTVPSFAAWGANTLYGVNRPSKNGMVIAFIYPVDVFDISEGHPALRKCLLKRSIA